MADDKRKKSKKKKKKSGPAEPSGVPGRRAGQVASEKARFDLGPDARVIGDALGTPPPGYGLTIVRAFVRDPRTLVAVWDVDDPDLLTTGGAAGRGGLVLRVVDDAGGELARVPVGERSGVYHVDVGAPGAVVAAEVGFARRGGGFAAAARSGLVRFPPDPSFRADAAEAFVRVEPDTDLRRLAAMERPPGPGHAERRAAASSARRLAERLRLAERARRAELAQASAEASRPAAPDAQAREEPDEPEDERGPSSERSRAGRAGPPAAGPHVEPPARRDGAAPPAAGTGEASRSEAPQGPRPSHGDAPRPARRTEGARPRRPPHENGRSGRGRR